MDRGSRMDVLLALKHTVEKTEGGSLKFLLINAVKCIDYLEESLAIANSEQSRLSEELANANQSVVMRDKLIHDYEKKLNAYKKKYGAID